MFRGTSLPRSAALGINITPVAFSAKRSYSVKVIERYERCRHLGSYTKNDTSVAIGRAGGPASGVQIRLDESSCKITDVKVRILGCGSAIASSSFMKGSLRRMTHSTIPAISRTQKFTRSHFSHQSSDGSIQGIPNDLGYKNTLSHVAKSSVQENSTLVYNPANFQHFPEDSYSDFFDLRTTPGLAYYDRTRYISVIDSLPKVLLFLRPRRFGKSLTLSMLAHFHGVEHKISYSKLFQDLAVHHDVQAGKVFPGQYLILSIDFAGFNYSSEAKVAEFAINSMINDALKRFHRTYADFLGDVESKDLIEELIEPANSISSFENCVQIVKEILLAKSGDPEHSLAGVKGIYLLADEYDAYSNEYHDLDDDRPGNSLRENKRLLHSGFWARVKSNIGHKMIQKCFITGVTPLSMTDHTSGFNISKNVSDKRVLAGLCGLSKEDVLASLRVPGVCDSDEEIHKCFNTMEVHFNGYRFSPHQDIPRVFNTNTCLEYLEGLLTKELTEPLCPSNSEPSERLLQVLAASPIAISTFESYCNNSPLDVDSWRTPIPYETLQPTFGIFQLGNKLNKPAWLSFMRYVGGLTYADEMPKKQLQVPNVVTIKRFANAVLNRYKLEVNAIGDALRAVVSTGDVSNLWGHYRKLMVQRDVGDNDLKNKTEENHRDSFHCVLLQNPLLRSKVELEVRKSPKSSGRIDMTISAPTTLRSSITEIKALRINFLDVKAAEPPSDPCRSQEYLKAMTLNRIGNVDQLLEIKFAAWDKHRAGISIADWIEYPDGPRDQLRKYWRSPEIVRHCREYNTVPVIIIGSRKIVIWEMNEDGVLGYPQLDGEGPLDG
ncbi:hypothetical protein BC936DRAFT_144021 [Jimgerdemannia flammicorona]|uniref:AAA-ATPase-like domain-containing protein n=1 Tax=Jimgerdemannia flammicorona TaxID=994334 RepID=A0A433DD67_9FUNG|nr:hypothetical protein BC936DRAFT_144021 [Jimgerdemannia flammicorona]